MAAVAKQVLSETKGWQARLELGFAQRGERTRLIHRRRLGPLAVQRAFYPEGDTCHVYLLHPPGGVVGGDQLEIDVKINNGDALITTPGATKFYRSAGAEARQTQTLRVETGATLEWLPQENIFFPGARLKAKTKIDLAADAHVAAWEIHCLGRPSNHERFDEGNLSLGFELWRNGSPAVLERLRVAADNLCRRSGLAGHPVTATLLINSCDDEALNKVREVLPEQAAATRIDDLLLIRYLGDNTEQARNTLVRAWSLLRPIALNKPTHLPRIWAT